MARFLHTADLHLGSAGDALPEEIARQREREITSSLPKIVDLALERDGRFCFLWQEICSQINSPLLPFCAM